VEHASNSRCGKTNSREQHREELLQHFQCWESGFCLICRRILRGWLQTVFEQPDKPARVWTSGNGHECCLGVY
jgi:hypothetical protein